MRWPPQCLLPCGAYHTCTQRVCVLCASARPAGRVLVRSGRVGRSCDGRRRRARESVVTWRVASGSRRAFPRGRPTSVRGAIVTCRDVVSPLCVSSSSPCCRRHRVLSRAFLLSRTHGVGVGLFWLFCLFRLFCLFCLFCFCSVGSVCSVFVLWVLFVLWVVLWVVLWRTASSRRATSCRA